LSRQDQCRYIIRLAERSASPRLQAFDRTSYFNAPMNCSTAIAGIVRKWTVPREPSSMEILAIV
jgi:hypothetical protein